MPAQSPIGRAEFLGTPAWGTWDYRAALGAAVVAVPAGAYLATVNAYCSAAGATIQIGAKPAIPIPVGGSLTIDVNGGMVGLFNVTFVGTDGYFVDWVVP